MNDGPGDKNKWQELLCIPAAREVRWPIGEEKTTKTG